MLTDEEFLKLSEQYSDELITPQDKYRLGLALEIKLYRYKITYVQAAIKYLEVDYNDMIGKGLLTIGATEQAMPTDPKKLDSWFTRLVGRLKKWDNLITAKEAELKELQPSESQQVTRNHFDEMLIELSSMLKFNLDENAITVSKYIVALKRYRKLVEKSKKK